MEETVKIIPKGVCGIYCILMTSSGKFYFGSSRDIRKRALCHLRLLRGNRHHNRHLQNAWNKYGEEQFIFIPILSCNPNELIDKESWLLNIANGWVNKPYNISSPSKVFDWTGRKHSEQTKRKMSQSARQNRNRKLSISDVIEIRNMAGKIPYSDLAKKFSVSTSTIYKIIKRKKWRET